MGIVIVIMTVIIIIIIIILYQKCGSLHGNDQPADFFSN